MGSLWWMQGVGRWVRAWLPVVLLGFVFSKALAQEDAFEVAVGQGLTALHQRQFEDAAASLSQALKLKPGDQAVVAALAQAQLGLTLSQIEALQQKVQAMAAREAWQQAVHLYRQVLALSAHVDFAKQGLEKAQRLAQIHQQLNSYLKNPSRLSAPSVRREASDWLQRAQSEYQPGPVLQALMTQLDQQLEAYSTNLTLVLISDGKTQVTVYKVGDLGRFQRKALDLKPGLYTLVGSRVGYRDVRVELDLKPKMQLDKPIEVVCREEI